MYPHLFDQLLTFAEYAVHAPKYGKVEAKSITALKTNQVWVADFGYLGPRFMWQCNTLAGYWAKQYDSQFPDSIYHFIKKFFEYWQLLFQFPDTKFYL